MAKPPAFLVTLVNTRKLPEVARPAYSVHGVIIKRMKGKVLATLVARENSSRIRVVILLV